MKKTLKKVFSPPSLRLKVAIILEVVLLLSVMLSVMFAFSRKTLRQEAMQNAEETLEGLVQQVDKVLLGVEQSSGNIYWDMMAHFNEPERMWTYCHRLVECNTDIMGCAIAFKPNFYPDQELFMAYVHRLKYDSPELVEAETYGSLPYTQQPWFTKPMQTCRSLWMDPQKDETGEGATFITFCLPISDRSGECVGVMAVDVSLGLLSEIVLAAKPSSNSYSIMLDRSGNYIVHPEREVRVNQTVFQHIGEGEKHTRDAVEAMLGGATGNGLFHLNGKDWHIFYKPFVRSAVQGRSSGDVNWSIGVIYPEEDVLGGYYQQLRHLFFNIFIGLLAFFVLTRLVISMQLKPLRMLTESVQSMADGNYSVTVPDTTREDEIGMFQQHFKKMQHALESSIGEQQQLTATLKGQSERLREIYEHTQTTADVKRNLLHNFTSQMLVPSQHIANSAKKLYDYQELSPEETQREAGIIKQQSTVILQLLDQMLEAPSPELRKEVGHE